MIIIGDSLVPYEDVFRIYHMEQINETKPNSTVIFKYNNDILTFTSNNDLPCAVIISSIKEALYANALNAKYLICTPTLAKEVQKVAENYMFDSKVLSIIESNDQFEEIASNEIDGVIYKNILG